MISSARPSQGDESVGQEQTAHPTTNSSSSTRQLTARTRKPSSKSTSVPILVTPSSPQNFDPPLEKTQPPPNHSVSNIDVTTSFKRVLDEVIPSHDSKRPRTKGRNGVSSRSSVGPATGPFRVDKASRHKIHAQELGRGKKSLARDSVTSMVTDPTTPVDIPADKVEKVVTPLRAIEIARGALSAMKAEISKPNMGRGRDHLLVAIEALMACRDNHFASQEDAGKGGKEGTDILGSY